MPGLMRSRVTGCLCLDCSGGWSATRTSEKREWRREAAEEHREFLCANGSPPASEG